MQEIRRMERPKRPKRFHTPLVQSLVGLALLLLPTVGETATVSITPPLSTVGVGDIFSVNVYVAGAVDLTSWQFDLKYNPSLLQAESVTEGPFLNSFGTTLFQPGVIDHSTGEISLVTNAFVDFTPPPNGDGELAIVHFKALGLGVSPLELRNLFLNLDSNVTATNGSVSVVPIPGTALLMSSGMLLLWGIGQWRTRTGAVV